MLTVAFYDAKSYDRQHFQLVSDSASINWQFHEFRLTQETASTAKGAQAVCVFVNDLLDAACLHQLHEAGIKLVALRCAGFNNVDLDTASSLGIAVVRVPAYSPNAVAEHTVGLLLALCRKIPRAYNRVRDHNFSLNGLVGFDLCGKTVGIVGTGKIGRITAQIFRGFDCQVVAYDPYPMNEWAEQQHIRYLPLNEVLEQSHIVSLHLPLTPESHHLLNESSLSRMKPGVYVVNTSRGKLIDTSALIQHLKSGHIGGVALDVYEEEEGVFFEDRSGSLPLDDELSLLLAFPNVLVTAHQAFLTNEALSEIARVTTENMLALDVGSDFVSGTQL